MRFRPLIGAARGVGQASVGFVGVLIAAAVLVLAVIGVATPAGAVLSSGVQRSVCAVVHAADGGAGGCGESAGGDLHAAKGPEALQAQQGGAGALTAKTFAARDTLAGSAAGAAKVRTFAAGDGAAGGAVARLDAAGAASALASCAALKAEPLGITAGSICSGAKGAVVYCADALCAESSGLVPVSVFDSCVPGSFGERTCSIADADGTHEIACIVAPSDPELVTGCSDVNPAKPDPVVKPVPSVAAVAGRLDPADATQCVTVGDAYAGGAGLTQACVDSAGRVWRCGGPAKVSLSCDGTRFAPQDAKCVEVDPTGRLGGSSAAYGGCAFADGAGREVSAVCSYAASGVPAGCEAASSSVCAGPGGAPGTSGGRGLKTLPDDLTRKIWMTAFMRGISECSPASLQQQFPEWAHHVPAQIIAPDGATAVESVTGNAGEAGNTSLQTLANTVQTQLNAAASAAGLTGQNAPFSPAIVVEPLNPAANPLWHPGADGGPGFLVVPKDLLAEPGTADQVASFAVMIALHPQLASTQAGQGLLLELVALNGLPPGPVLETDLPANLQELELPFFGGLQEPLSGDILAPANTLTPPQQVADALEAIVTAHPGVAPTPHDLDQATFNAHLAWLMALPAANVAGPPYTPEQLESDAWIDGTGLVAGASPDLVARYRQWRQRWLDAHGGYDHFDSDTDYEGGGSSGEEDSDGDYDPGNAGGGANGGNDPGNGGNDPGGGGGAGDGAGSGGGANSGAGGASSGASGGGAAGHTGTCDRKRKRCDEGALGGAGSGAAAGAGRCAGRTCRKADALPHLDPTWRAPSFRGWWNSPGVTRLAP